MKKIISFKTSLIVISAIVITSCHTKKKSATTANTNPVVASKPANGVYEPGNEELTAIQKQYSDVTLDKLKEGHKLYTQGACVKCHGAKNIYNRTETQWKIVIDDMSQKAHITENEKDAVYKYVLAIKAARPN